MGWVVAVRCLLVFIPFIFALYFVAEAAGILTDQTGLFDIALVFVFEVILYQRIGRHIGDTRGSEAEQVS